MRPTTFLGEIRVGVFARRVSKPSADRRPSNGLAADHRPPKTRRQSLFLSRRSRQVISRQRTDCPANTTRYTRARTTHGDERKSDRQLSYAYVRDSSGRTHARVCVCVYVCARVVRVRVFKTALRPVRVFTSRTHDGESRFLLDSRQRQLLPFVAVTDDEPRRGYLHGTVKDTQK